MSARPAVSVVVPFLDSENTIGACVESLLGQRDVGAPYELILVDNGSTDSSAAWVTRYRGVTLLREACPGAYAARNAGIREAVAPIVAFTDADCVAEPSWLRSILDGMKARGLAILVGRCRYPATASSMLRLLGAWEDAKIRYVLERCSPAYYFAYCNNMAVRASLFEEIGLFEEWERAADSEFVHRASAARPDLAIGYRSSMVVTHLEFVRARDRAARLRLYTRTNSRIATFRELGPRQRLGALLYLLRGRPTR